MSSYSNFAKYYDVLTNDVNYQARAEYLVRIFELHQLKPEIVLDLACGTGSMSIELGKLGYDVIGVDSSIDMLSVANEKAVDFDILLLCQKMENLDLYGTVNAVVCNLDSINHLPNIKKVEQCFRRVSLFLEKDGLFIFDINTPYKIKNILGNNTFVYDYPQVFCVWQNSYLEKTRKINFDITFFEKNATHYQRFDEHFSEKEYCIKELTDILNKTGMEVVSIYNELTFADISDDSLRAVFVAKKV
jgi:ubiquinone/menaquinone biosynthesis C-methylase UbiE